MKRVTFWLAMCGVVLLAADLAVAAQQETPGRGRGGQPPPPFQNLQVFPKDVARADLLATMRLFNQALGVPCNYCHVQEGDGGRNDMASDEKAPKKTARVMMRMMAHVNDTLPSDLGRAATDVTRVQCITCHRESAIPKIPDPPPAPQRGGQPPA